MAREADALPIKVVAPWNSDYRPPAPPKKRKREIVPVTEELREQLSNRLTQVKEYFRDDFSSAERFPLVAKVELRRDALAKTHRPTDLLNQETCPIIGGESLGQLLVSISPLGIERLQRTIDSGDTKPIRAAISTIETILPYTVEDVLGGNSLHAIETAAEAEQRPLKARLFRHHSPADDVAADRRFHRVLSAAGINGVDPLDYAPNMRIYKIRNLKQHAVRQILGLRGILRTLTPFPEFYPVKTASRKLEALTSSHFPAPVKGVDYPILGIIDSGTDPNNSYLQAWVHERYDELVRPEFQDHGHGSFVAGLIIHGHRLNHQHPGFPDGPCKIVDVVAMDRRGISEFQLITAIDVALEKFPYVKVWNLSLSGGTPCEDAAFSDLAAALDERSRKHSVLFVVAAGNYETAPLRGWPPELGIGEADRICPPADSTHAITVGSLAHIATNSTRVRPEEPSPFSRRGPGPAYLIKPEVSLYGGNCDSEAKSIQTGIISVDGSGSIAEDIGTSFACPLVSMLTANVLSELQTDPTSHASLLTKGLLIHSAFIGNQLPDSQRLKYAGLGRPSDLGSVMNSVQSAATIVFEVPVKSGLNFIKERFPMPVCLAGDRKLMSGEVFMTLLYHPPVDQEQGFEYCRCNVKASLGTLMDTPDEPEDFDRQVHREVHPFPEGPSEGLEESLVKQGYKWSPLKLYYRRFRRLPAEKVWRLRLDMLARSGESIAEQDVVLIITIRDPHGKAPVYNEMVRRMQTLNWNVRDLQIKSRVRQRPKRPI
ncbi:S8 family peptidase [Aquisphaera insulae]|uniref:S8 family peptidase n=1 Tax=Aquisphaera insulae TaxID=2712864 RepID=UPI0013EBC2E5|nr:S8 family peptidase [Aquisphaera insulae]